MANIIENPQDGLSAAWKKFLNKFHEMDTLKVSEWKEVHILAYIDKRYEQLFKNKFSWSMKGAPSKSTEVYLIKRIFAALNTTNKNIVKDYIDWVYDYKIIPKRTHFRKIGFFLTDGFANEFLHQKLKKKTITRSTPLPESYKAIAEELGVEVNTYGDLAFIQMYVEKNQEDKQNPKYLLFGNLELLGIDWKQIKEMPQ
jgi:hypothetical protein